MARQFSSDQQPKHVIVVRPQKKRRHFRLALVAAPATILLAMWVASGIRIGFSWDHLLTAWGIRHRERFSQLACLGLICVAVVAIARILRHKKQKDTD
jgi:hypothetical protein